MDAAKIAAVGIIAAVLSLTIKKSNPEIAMQVGIGAGVLIFLMLLQYLAEAVEFIRNLTAQYAAAYEGFQVVLKIIAIAYITEFAVQSLKDAGEGAIASKVELAGKVIIMVVTLPLLGAFQELVLSLL